MGNFYFHCMRIDKTSLLEWCYTYSICLWNNSLNKASTLYFLLTKVTEDKIVHPHELKF